jgi:hypothetical protein
MHRYTLILLHRGDIYRDDFREIISLIKRIAPDILTILGSHQNAAPLPDVAWSRPTLVVSFDDRFKMVPKRGVIYGACVVEKQIQAELFKKAGVQTPQTAVFQFGSRLNESHWGQFVVLKFKR